MYKKEEKTMTRVLIPLAQGCEELEAVTIIDLLRRAGIDVISAGLESKTITASRGVVLIADRLLADILDQHFDLIVLPGGLPGSDHLNADPRIQQLLQTQAQRGGFCAAICAAPKVLASAGLLEGKSATSYPGVLAQMALNNTECLDSPVVIDGQIITSRSAGTAMDFSLALIALLLGEEKRAAVEAGLARP
jgi:4-methyl-5(b-hydroxyethyl)-thiazole monophosphate biosynthesis